MNEFDKKIGLNLDINNKIIFPNQCSSIRFDIGLSYCAPNSKLWLDHTKKTLVIGIEPIPSNIDSIKTYGLLNYENYILLNCALDNVDVPTHAIMFETNGDPGCSSLYKPTKYLPYSVKNEILVPVISFDYILSKINWDIFPYIELIKIDTQGNDYNVLLSMKDYIKKTIYILVECTTFNHYEKSSYNDETLINNYMIQNGFICKKEEHADVIGWDGKRVTHPVDKIYMNTLFAQKAEELGKIYER